MPKEQPSYSNSKEEVLYENDSFSDLIKEVQEMTLEGLDLLSDSIEPITFEKVQEILIVLGFLKQGISFNRAVRAFQAQNKLKVDGIIGSKTEKALKVAYANYLAVEHKTYTWQSNEQTSFLPVLVAPEFATRHFDHNPITEDFIKQKYGVYLKVERRGLYDVFIQGQKKLDLEQKIKELDGVLSSMSLSKTEKGIFRLVLSPKDKIEIKVLSLKNKELKPLNNTSFELLIPYDSSPKIMRVAILKLLKKIKFARQVLSQKGEIYYDDFFADPAVEMALKIPDSWVKNLNQVKPEEVRLWIARSLYLSGFRGTPKQSDVSSHLETIREIRTEYKSIPLFYNRNVVVLAARGNLETSVKDDSSFVHPEEVEELKKQEPRNYTILRENEGGTEIKAKFRQHLINTPPPTCFYLRAHGSANEVVINADVIISQAELVSWLILRYKKYPNLLSADIELQDLICLGSCNGHTFLRGIYEKLESVYGEASFPISLVDGEYGQLTYSGILSNYRVDRTMEPLWSKSRITLGDIMENNQCKLGLNSPTIYAPIGRKKQEELKRKGLPYIGVKQLTEQLPSIHQEPVFKNKGST